MDFMIMCCVWTYFENEKIRDRNYDKVIRSTEFDYIHR